MSLINIGHALRTPWPRSKQGSNFPSAYEFINDICAKRNVDAFMLFEWAVGKGDCYLYSKDWCSEVAEKLGINCYTGTWMEIIYKLISEWEASGRIIPGKRMVLTEKRKNNE